MSSVITEARPQAVTGEGPSGAATRSRPSGTVWLWAALGVVGFAYMAWVWIPWLFAGHARQPSPGHDPYHYIAVLRATEVISTSVFFCLLWYSLINPLRRGRGLTLDGKMFIGGIVASSLDIFYAFMSPTWAMNAHGVSLGTWATHIPGFANPGQDQNAWGLLWCLPAYIWLGLGASLVGTALLRWLRPLRRDEHRRVLSGRARRVLCGVRRDREDLAADHVYDYVSVPSSLTLWAGKLYQFPLYSPLLIGLYCLAYTWCGTPGMRTAGAPWIVMSRSWRSVAGSAVSCRCSRSLATPG